MPMSISARKHLLRERLLPALTTVINSFSFQKKTNGTKSRIISLWKDSFIKIILRRLIRQPVPHRLTSLISYEENHHILQFRSHYNYGYDGILKCKILSPTFKCNLVLSPGILFLGINYPKKKKRNQNPPGRTIRG